VAERTLTCLVCPQGCELRAAVQGDRIVSLEGHECARGEQYAAEELFRPLRVLTTTVRLQSEHVPRLPVKTSAPVPRERLRACMAAARKRVVRPPVWCGEVVARDLAGTGAELVATRTVGPYPAPPNDGRQRRAERP